MADELNVDQKAEVYSAAVIEALAIAGQATGAPDINAALAALMYSAGYLISKIEDRNTRRVAEKTCNDMLGKQVSAHVNMRLIEQTRRGEPDA